LNGLRRTHSVAEPHLYIRLRRLPHLYIRLRRLPRVQAHCGCGRTRVDHHRSQNSPVAAVSRGALRLLHVLHVLSHAASTAHGRAPALHVGRLVHLEGHLRRGDLLRHRRRGHLLRNL